MEHNKLDQDTFLADALSYIAEVIYTPWCAYCLLIYQHKSLMDVLECIFCRMCFLNQHDKFLLVLCVQSRVKLVSRTIAS